MTLGNIRNVRRYFERQAAPEGGAFVRMRTWVWGCLFGCLCSTIAFAADLPSGQNVSLMEVRSDDLGTDTWLRFRFLAPAIARDSGVVDFAGAEADMAHLCAHVAVPYVAEHGSDAGLVVISLSDRALAFGESDPAATQYFDAFRVEGDRCIWEGL